MGFVPQNDIMHRNLSVEENLTYSACFRHVCCRDISTTSTSQHSCNAVADCSFTLGPGRPDSNARPSHMSTGSL